MTNKLNALLGMARRAGKLCSGESQVEAMLKKGKGHLLILAEDSPGAKDKFGCWATDLQIPILTISSKQELGAVIGLSPRAVILVMDQGFAQAMINAR